MATPQIPEPVLHAFSSERLADLRVPSSSPFYEESTFWNPSWTTAPGAVQITDITDMTTTMEVVGTGELLSKASFAAQVGYNLVDFGHPDPKCPVCPQNTAADEELRGLGCHRWVSATKKACNSRRNDL